MSESEPTWKKKWREKAKKIKEERGSTDQICKQFGCGKHLSHIEAMYSDYCFKHAREQNKKK